MKTETERKVRRKEKQETFFYVNIYELVREARTHTPSHSLPLSRTYSHKQVDFEEFLTIMKNQKEVGMHIFFVCMCCARACVCVSVRSAHVLARVLRARAHEALRL